VADLSAHSTTASLQKGFFSPPATLSAPSLTACPALDEQDPLLYPLLRWIITSNRAHLSLMRPDRQVAAMRCRAQFAMLSSPPEVEARFNALRAAHGSFYMWHGSSYVVAVVVAVVAVVVLIREGRFSNWHSILRRGLKNYSAVLWCACVLVSWRVRRHHVHVDRRGVRTRHLRCS
jgi:hypothetical protein